VAKKVLRLSKYGYVWEVDAGIIAHNKADWLKLEGDYQDEYDYVLANPDEIIQWFVENMFWDEIPEENKRVIKTPPIPKSPFELNDLDDKWEYSVLNV
jgi:hypothetical protein